MKKDTKVKIFLGLTYISIIILFLWLIFSKFTLSELTSYEFIKNNINYINSFKQNNFFLISLIFLIFTIVWILILGFAAPIFLLGGFIFGKWIGTILVTIGLSIGATLVYIIANYFFKELIKEKFSKKFFKLNEKFKKNEFLFFLIYRFIGGIPFVISNVLPCIFNVKVSNFFWATLIGIIPQLFIVISIGSGLEKIVDQNIEPPSIVSIITSPDIYIPLLAFFGLVLITIFIRRFFFQK